LNPRYPWTLNKEIKLLSIPFDAKVYDGLFAWESFRDDPDGFLFL